MPIDFAKLVSQGRAKAMGVAWSPEELEALLTLEKERSISRTLAADYIRNGIMTPDAYDKAKEAEYTPKTLDEMHADGEALAKDAVAAIISEPVVLTPTDPDPVAPTEDAAVGGLPVLTREELEAKATALGIGFRSNTSDATLSKKIREAEEPK